MLEKHVEEKKKAEEFAVAKCHDVDVFDPGLERASLYAACKQSFLFSSMVR